MTTTEYSESIRKNLLQPFYVDRIEKHYIIFKEHGEAIDIAITLFWHSVADFYGKIYLIGEENKIFTDRYFNKGKSYN